MPFYYSGCSGNGNNFISREACEADCPKEIRKFITNDYHPFIVITSWAMSRTEKIRISFFIIFIIAHHTDTSSLYLFNLVACNNCFNSKTKMYLSIIQGLDVLFCLGSVVYCCYTTKLLNILTTFDSKYTRNHWASPMWRNWENVLCTSLTEVSEINTYVVIKLNVGLKQLNNKKCLWYINNYFVYVSC